MKVEDAERLYCPFNMESQYDPNTKKYIATGHKCVAEKCMAWKQNGWSVDKSGHCIRLETR